jgi:hypothetical protein
MSELREGLHPEVQTKNTAAEVREYYRAGPREAG